MSAKNQVTETNRKSEFARAASLEWKGQTFAVQPLPDAALLELSGVAEQIAALLAPLFAPSVAITPDAVLPYAPQVVKLLLPSASRLIAACLRVDEADVSDGMTLGKKAEALACIVETEDLPLVIENVKRLMNLFPKTGASLSGALSPA